MELMNRLPLELERQVTGELDTGETILWVGQPSPARFMRQGLAPALMGIPFTAFAIFWVTMASVGVSHAPSAGPFLFFPLFGIPFVLVGLGLLTSPLFLRKKATRTVYAVTNKRILILAGSRNNTLTTRSVLPEQMVERTRTQGADGSGDLIFTRALMPPTAAAYGYVNSGNYNRTANIPLGFYGIPSVKEVDDLIRQTFE